jgi:Na+-transporting methylmalonyl-CoA/oxaloacetate decarboxylase gamma subunit
MDPTTTSGPIMTVIGLSTVFFALALLMAVVAGMAHFLDRDRRRLLAPVATAGGAHVSVADENHVRRDEELRLVAIAAYALYRSRAVTVPRPQPTSAWLRAGRSAQVSRLRTKP